MNQLKRVGDVLTFIGFMAIIGFIAYAMFRNS